MQRSDTLASSSSSSEALPTPPPPSDTEERRPGRGLYIGGGVLVCATVVMVILLGGARRTSVAKEAQTRATEVAAGPRVRIAGVETGGGSRSITLTGESRPFFSVTLYSKVSGYLVDVKVDKGDRVHKGEVLAIVESPETDEAYASAIADAKNKRVIADRDAQLIARKLIAPEESETAETDATQAEAHARALATLKGYEQLRAPFDGIVTARYADPGALMQNAQTTQTSALPVVAIGQIDSLRVFVYADQSDAPDIKRGTAVAIEDPERPGRAVHATVTRFPGELDPTTRTLMAEIDVPNHEGMIEAGSILRVTMQLRAPPYVRVPADAVFARNAKTYVVVVTPENRVAFKEVHVIENDGDFVRLMPGDVSTGERVALDLGESVPDGQRVQPTREPSSGTPSD